MSRKAGPFVLSFFMFQCESTPASVVSVEASGDLVEQSADEGFAYLRTEHGILPVRYERDGDDVLVQGDILVRADDFHENTLSEHEIEAALSGIEDDEQPGGPARAVVSSLFSRRWPNGIIPYSIEANVQKQEAIAEAIAHWEQHTPYRFVPRTNQKDYVVFDKWNKTGVCASHLGRVGGKQRISTPPTGCAAPTLIHEIGHAVGFIHEICRADRDNHVTIQWNNIKSGYAYNFQTYLATKDAAQAIGPYDFISVMHYHSLALAKGLAPTFVTVQPNTQAGSTGKLSPGDIAAAFKMYNNEWSVGGGAKSIVYSETSYQGSRQGFYPGQYYASRGQLRLFPIGPHQNKVKSISVGAGMVVTACASEPPFFAGGGECQTFEQQAATLGSLEGRIAFLSVTRAVSAYEHQSSSGARQMFGIGVHRADHGDLSIVGNDRISSLTIPPGMHVRMCVHSDGSGGCQDFSGYVGYVGDAMNDVASYIEVRPAVTVFEHYEFEGASRTFLPGVHSTFNPLPNQSISSIVVGPRLSAQLCRGPGTTNCERYHGDVNYVGPGMNDKTTVLDVQPQF